VSRGTRSEHN